MNDTRDRGRFNTSLAFALSTAFVAWTGFLAGVVASQGGWWPDDVIYRFQGKCLAIGRAWVPAPPEPSAFLVSGTTVYEGRWFGKYYPGYPLLLAAGEKLGAPWIVNPLLGGIAVLGTFFFGRAIASTGVGLAAALALAVSPVHLVLSLSYLSHATSVLMAVGAAFAVFRAREQGSRAWAVVAGILASWCALTRPFTLLLLGIPLAVLVARDLLRRRPATLRWMIPFALGLLPGFVGILLWNAILTGSPTTSAYEVAKPKDGLGFIVTQPIERGGPGLYTPSQALGTMRAQLRSAADMMFPVPFRGPAAFLLVLPLLAPFVLPEIRRRGTILVAFALILVAGHFFYPGTRGVSATGLGPRYYMEGIPFYLVLLAMSVGALLQRAHAPRWSGPALGVALAAAALGAGVPNMLDRVRDRHENPGMSQNNRLETWLDRLEPGRRLVFVDVSTYDLYSTCLANRPDLMDDNLVAVYRFPEQNRAVMDAFSGRDTFLWRWDPQVANAHMRRYDPAEDTTGPPPFHPYTLRRFAHPAFEQPSSNGGS